MTTPTQHPASTSDAAKRHGRTSETSAPALTDTERRALAAASCGNCGERTAVLNLVERIVTDRLNDALDPRYAGSDHRAAKYWRAKREAEVRAEAAEAEVERLRDEQDGAALARPRASEQGQGATGEAPTDAYPAGHGWTPGHGTFSSGPPACRVMLARYPCNWSQEEHDPDLPPVDVDLFGYRRKPTPDEGAGA